jgi:iron complex transport system permease protein
MMPTAHRRLLFLLLVILSVASIAGAAATGSVTLDWSQWTTALTNPGSEYGELVWRLRIPRATAAWAVGALLSLSGCLMQVLLRNPLADPYILGVSGGASFAALLGMTLGAASAYLPALAWTGALISILIVFSLARGDGPWSGTRLLLTGVVTASGWAALISLLLTLGPDSSLRGMLFWLIGDLSYASLPSWALATLALIFVICFGMARSLNVLAMGETTARLLGEPTRHLLWLVYLLASVLTATAVLLATRLIVICRRS